MRKSIRTDVTELEYTRSDSSPSQPELGAYRASPNSEFLFVSEKGTPITRQAAWRIFREAGEKASIEVKVHPRILKDSCGYYLADRGCDTRLIQEYLAHKNIQNTVRYTQTNAKRFEGLGR